MKTGVVGQAIIISVNIGLTKMSLLCVFESVPLEKVTLIHMIVMNFTNIYAPAFVLRGSKTAIVHLMVQNQDRVTPDAIQRCRDEISAVLKES